MGQFDIEKALISYLESLPLGLPLYYENDRRKPPNQGNYALVNVVHQQPSVATLGEGGEDNHEGFLQILLKYPMGEGAGEAKQKAQDIAGFFTAGVKAEYLTQSVTIRTCGIQPSFESSSRYTLPITITWYARTIRR